MMLLCQVSAYIQDAAHEVKLFRFVCQLWSRRLAGAIIKGKVGQIGNVAVECHDEGNLYVFGAEIFASEQAGVFPVGFFEDFRPV